MVSGIFQGGWNLTSRAYSGPMIVAVAALRNWGFGQDVVEFWWVPLAFEGSGLINVDVATLQRIGHYLLSPPQKTSPVWCRFRH